MEEEPPASGLAARGDLRSALPFLPVVLCGGALFWPPAAQESLRALALGPDVSRVASGDVLADALTDLRLALALPALPPLAADGLALFFDDLLSRAQARGWFAEVVPNLARLLLRLPALLEDHYAKAGHGASGLWVLASQDAGVVLLSQELVAALLTCSRRAQACLPTIDFDGLFTYVPFALCIVSLTIGEKTRLEYLCSCSVHRLQGADSPIAKLGAESRGDAADVGAGRGGGSGVPVAAS